MAAIEIGLSVTGARRLPELVSLAPLNAGRLAVFLKDDEATSLVPGQARATHLYFGSEFCEHLFPEPAALEQAIAACAELELTLVLATPIANDALLAAILRAAGQLPASAEILVNDWGVASALRAAQPRRRLVAGRQLAKTIKDPRVPSPAWMKPYPSGFASSSYRSVLARLGIGRIELDVPPFATCDSFAVPDLGVSVWAPFAYVAKGRICKIGSLAQRDEDKFAPGGPCHHECLSVLEVGAAPGPTGLVSYVRGNSTYYRHDRAMAQVVHEALANGGVSRLVLSQV